jgi:3-phenylpropionate/cinnamic acid dioxygenase small subunit
MKLRPLQKHHWILREVVGLKPARANFSEHYQSPQSDNSYVVTTSLQLNVELPKFLTEEKCIIFQNLTVRILCWRSNVQKVYESI